MNIWKKERIFTLGFLIVICGGAIASMAAPDKIFSSSENRYLKQKPVFSVNSLIDGSYGQDYDEYLSDQFPFRELWVRVKTWAERARLKTDTNGVFFGRDGYLIERFQAEDLLGQKLEKELDRIQNFAESMELIVGRDHVRIMLVPSASEILSDKLPFLASPYQQSAISDRLEKKIGSEIMAPVIDALNEVKDRQIYYRTDHHWTSEGAYYGYVSWAESLGLAPWSREQYQVETVDTEFRGAVYSKVNFGDSYDRIQIFYPKISQEYQVYYDGGDQEYGSLYQYKALEGKDKYSVFLDGNHGLTEIINRSISEERKGKSLLIVKDSFANSFAPFAVNHFETVYMIDLRYFNRKPEEFAMENQVTDVLILYQIPGLAR